MTHAFHHCLVVERKDILGSGALIILQKSVGLIGSLLKHDSSGAKLAQEIYERLKIMIYMNYEQDRL